jgi:hypothetical protein
MKFFAVRRFTTAMKICPADKRTSLFEENMLLALSQKVSIIFIFE